MWDLWSVTYGEICNLMLIIKEKPVSLTDRRDRTKKTFEISVKPKDKQTKTKLYNTNSLPNTAKYFITHIFVNKVFPEINCQCF